MSAFQFFSFLPVQFFHGRLRSDRSRPFVSVRSVPMRIRCSFVCFALAGFLFCVSATNRAEAIAVFINEFHYDNSGGDTGEFIEIAGPAGTGLSGYSLVLYNGANGASYNTLALTGTIGNQQNGFGTVSFGYPAD